MANISPLQEEQNSLTNGKTSSISEYIISTLVKIFGFSSIILFYVIFYFLLR